MRVRKEKMEKSKRGRVVGKIGEWELGWGVSDVHGEGRVKIDNRRKERERRR
jgi:hypothetical protein